MKTNRTARNIVRTRLIAVCLVFLGLAGVAYKAGEFLGKQSARARVTNGATFIPKNVDLGNLIAAN